MPHASNLSQRMNIRTIVWPIFIETLLRMSIMTIDVTMVAQYSQEAVAAIGLTGQFVVFMILSFLVVASGSAILIGQHLGAKQPDEAQAYSEAGILLMLIFSVMVGVLFFFASGPIVGLYNMAPVPQAYAQGYLLIVGSLSIGMALSIGFATILRAYGFSKSPMVIQLLSGLLNAVGNFIALFGPFGIPVTGVAGVAIATVASQLFSAVVSYGLIRHHKVPFAISRLFKTQRKRLKAILKLGLPNAGEGLSYNLAQVTIMFFIAQLGTAALAAATITQTLERVIFAFAMAMGNGSQILASYMVGQNRKEELQRNVNHYWISGVIISFLMTGLMYSLRTPLAGFFTNDPNTQRLIAHLLVVAFFLETGRAVNLIVINTLKGTGDVVFPVQIGIVSMWGIGVVLAYFLGLHWSLGLVGVWIAVSLDEWTRAIIVIIRWQRGSWKNKSRVSVLHSAE
ncbi:MATE family efflux transporter [Reinekea thalattae]|uniref:MATE family efflux transporter n=1 Tax=Reinekea thalattae TaxID=2593301 RepID=A0A5C8ZBJ2_9GAMM|nr:MATE family efflux transporter [Reinekea thalattae]TXR54814.1 MATE family efflux transporter [Reinekea thalattae]